ncbi:MAG: Mbeg1-like protein [Clostridia bacterium]
MKKNIINYVNEFSFTFEQEPLNEVDSLVFCQLSYLKLEKVFRASLLKTITLEQLNNLHEESVWSVRKPELNKKLLEAVGESVRFKDVSISNYVSLTEDVEDKQFSATTYALNDIAYVAFRGTDATVVGWKEDFNIISNETIPSQLEAVKYLNEVAPSLPVNFYIGGHSKGGNLAVFASVNCDKSVQNRLIYVFNNDGPGLRKEMAETPKYISVKDRIITIVPESSLFGVLLQNDDYLTIVSNGFWLMQHDPFNWAIHDGCFEYKSKITGNAKRLADSLNEWFYTADEAQKDAFVNTLNMILTATGEDSFKKIALNYKKNLPIILDKIKNINAETSENITEALKIFGKLVFESLKPDVTSITHKFIQVKAKLNEVKNPLSSLKDKVGKTNKLPNGNNLKE